MNKYLSRKFVLSSVIFILAVYNMAFNFITQDHFLWAMMATGVSYIVSKSLMEYKEAKRDVDRVSFLDRVVAMFSREYSLSLAIIIIAQLFIYYGKIDGTTWFAIVSAIAGAYNIGNAVGKI